ncbi:MAG TPA: DUF4157 domain-containing protein [Acidimicrobiales bacterium]|nr:DUF4157 domain-containing protein [Acidimicrobiales bacterium]
MSTSAASQVAPLALVTSGLGGHRAAHGELRRSFDGTGVARVARASGPGRPGAPAELVAASAPAVSGSGAAPAGRGGPVARPLAAVPSGSAPAAASAVGRRGAAPVGRWRPGTDGAPVAPAAVVVHDPAVPLPGVSARPGRFFAGEPGVARRSHLARATEPLVGDLPARSAPASTSGRAPSAAGGLSAERLGGSSASGTARDAGRARPAVPGSDRAVRPTAPSSTAASVASVAAMAPPASAPLVQRFLTELNGAPAEAPRPLPEAHAPLARAIVGERPVAIATGAATRRALAAVGKVAATVGSVVHLARRPDTDRRSTEILAHELTHVAHPSPVPRFFDGHLDTEERRARTTGRQAATSGPGGRAVGTSGLPVGGARPFVDTTPRPAAPPALPGDGQTIRRSPSGVVIGGHRGATSSGSSAPPSRPAPPVPVTSPAPPESSPSESAPSESAPRSRAAELAELDELIRKIEDRVVARLERRGGHTGRIL